MRQVKKISRLRFSGEHIKSNIGFSLMDVGHQIGCDE